MSDRCPLCNTALRAGWTHTTTTFWFEGAGVAAAVQHKPQLEPADSWAVYVPPGSTTAYYRPNLESAMILAEEMTILAGFR